MAQKKSRAFFTCPRWGEVAGAGAESVPAKVAATIGAGKPVARSTLRKALLAVSQATGQALDPDAYIVDSRAAR